MAMTTEKANEIKRRYAEGEKVTALAKEYGVHHATISRIVRQSARQIEKESKYTIDIKRPTQFPTYQSPPIQRILDRVEKMKGHWVWAGAVDGNGYAVADFDGRRRFVHRVLYELMRPGQLENGQVLKNLCNVTNCVDPNHWIPAHRMPKPTRLNPAVVAEIREKAKIGHSITDIARMYQVSHSTISRIIAEQAWAGGYRNEKKKAVTIERPSENMRTITDDEKEEMRRQHQAGAFLWEIAWRFKMPIKKVKEIVRE